MVLGLNYQRGQNLFNQDGTATINNDVMNDIVKYFVDLYRVDGVAQKTLVQLQEKAFGQGQSAMVLCGVLL